MTHPLLETLTRPAKVGAIRRSWVIATRNPAREKRRAWDSNPQALAGNGFQVRGGSSWLLLALPKQPCFVQASDGSAS